MFKGVNWQDVVIHNDESIKGFFGPYRFLSNFHLSPVSYEEITYPSAENAYQAAKVQKEFRENFLDISPMQSKKDWKKYPLMDKTAEEWDKRKYDVMYKILFDKFTRNDDLFEQLLTTHDKYLEELNWWRDIYWGYDIFINHGENNLGKILMEIRELMKPIL